MAKTYDSLNSQAETIRTNTLPSSNTATLVGQMLKDIIEKVQEVNTSSSGAVTDMTVASAADASALKLTFSLNAGEKTITRTVALPTVDSATAGVMTPAQMSQITSSLNSMSQNILNLSNSYTEQNKAVADLQRAMTGEQTTRKDADDALNSSMQRLNDTLAGSIKEVANDFKEFKESVGVEDGIAPLNTDGVVSTDFLPMDDIKVNIGREPGMAFPGVAGKELEDSMQMVQSKLGLVPFVNVNRMVGGNYTFDTAVQRIIRSGDYYGDIMVQGVIITYRTDSTHWEIKQYIASSVSETDFINPDNWQDLGGGGSSAVFNPTVAYPISGFYSLYDPDNTAMSAVDVAWAAGKASFGMLLTIQVSKKIWKTYQFIGSTLTQQAWQDTANWQDFGSLAAGSETYVNINNLIDASGKVVYYTLSSAVAALIAYQESTAVKYIKRGLVISFLSEPNKTMTYQFQGDNTTDASQTTEGATLWREFGKGDDINVSDTPTEGGKDPFSTGGAYTNTPTDINIQEEEGGVYKFALTNAAGDQIGEQRQIVIKGSGGSVQATTVSIALKKSTVYGAVGSTMLIEAAVMSVTTTPSGDSLNSIARIDLVDRSTGTVLQTLNANTESSANLTDDFKFKIDISDYFATTAGSRSFRLVAYDDGDHSGNKNVSAVGVDATVVSQQTLNYTASTVLQENGSAVSIPLYSFPNNSSSKGIHATAEINPSVASVACAFFRTDKYSPDATNLVYAYFHAKANLNEDKGDAKVFGFEGVEGYNKGCLNYGDFKELVAARGQNFSEFKAQVLADTSALQPGVIYMLSEFCGPKTAFIENDGSGRFVETTEVADAVELDITLAELLAVKVAEYDWSEVYKTTDGKFAKYEGGQWIDTTGSMTYDKTTKKWSVAGRVLNPTQCYEHLKYNGLNWYQGVNSVDDMVQLDPATGKPLWLSHYESRYPDDDDLNALYESGKKVPYYLYENLMWMQQCNHNLTEADGDITIDGKTVKGTKANRAKKFAHEIRRYWRVKLALYYYIKTDYEAAVDQRSKNMMQTIMLCEDGVMRSDFNNWYDGDCTNGSDNDCGLTIPSLLNPLLVGEGEQGRLYQGWDSVFFQQLNQNPVIWLEDYREGDDASGYTDKSRFVTLHDVADEMRRATDKQGLKIFSYDGLYQIWMTKRILKWAKLISSFDGERKYIQNSKASANYFFALHGLRLDDLPEFIKTRFAYRDGYYKVGDLYTDPMKMRASGKAITVTVTAAKDGFFGIGEDRADTAADSTYLKQGESYTFFGDKPRSYSESDTMLYVFGAASLASLDVSHTTPKAQGWDIQYCRLLQHFIVGGNNYVPYTADGTLNTLNLGNMPFLKSLDIRGTLIASVNAGMCPRLTSILASGSHVQSIEIAETLPIDELTLPSTLKAVKFVNLPKLTYTLMGGSLQIASLANVQTVRIEHCQSIEPMTMLQRIIDTQSGNRQLTAIRIVQELEGDGALLTQMLALGIRGITEDGKLQERPIVECQYQLTRVREQSYIDNLTQHIEGLTVVMSPMAYINAVIDFLGEQYSGEAEVDSVTLDNINDYLKLYNGETYDDYYNRLATDNEDILTIIDR